MIAPLCMGQVAQRWGKKIGRSDLRTKRCYHGGLHLSTSLPPVTGDSILGHGNTYPIVKMVKQLLSDNLLRSGKNYLMESGRLPLILGFRIHCKTNRLVSALLL